VEWAVPLPPPRKIRIGTQDNEAEESRRFLTPKIAQNNTLVWVLLRYRIRHQIFFVPSLDGPFRPGQRESIGELKYKKKGNPSLRKGEKTMDLNEPKIEQGQILVLDDDTFNPGHLCLVTGCGTGIGRAVAIALAANNITTVGVDINREEAEKTQKMVDDIGGRMVFFEADLTDDEMLEKIVADASKLGQIKFLANIAGIQHIDPIEKFPMEKYDLMQRLMLRTPFFLSRLVIPHMKKSPDGTGVIAHMASIHAHICTQNKPVYNITKFGLRALAQSISAEGGGMIRSFTVSTGFVKTALALGQIPAQAEQRGISEQDVVTDVMMGRSRVKEMMAPVDAANLFIFGFSRFARYLVGGDLLFDGGVVLTY
jgi:3-hydroxybutyrate dehydrogenase